MDNYKSISNYLESKDNLLKEMLDKNKNYKNFIESLPEAILIVQENKIVQVNSNMCKLLGIERNKILNTNIFYYSKNRYKESLRRKIYDVIKNKRKGDAFEYECILKGGKKIFLQSIIGYLEYGEKPAVFIVFRDNTEMEKELNKAALFQRNSLQTEFNFEDYMDVKRIYVPAKIISGDFYKILKKDDKHIIGALIDVRGKGISAALSISAINILFLQEINNNNKPMNIIENLNKTLVKFYDETYIAVCVFEIDFEKNILDVVGAGINKFFYISQGGKCEEKIMRGPFLGMFENSEFEQIKISIKSKDKIIFFTDGFDFMLKKEEKIKKSLANDNLKKLISTIENSIETEMFANGQLKDDCTVLAINIR